MAKSNKPLVWSLFAGGGMLTAFVTPVMIFVTGLAVPLGLLSADILAYDRVVAFVGHPIGKIILFGVIFLSLWHAGHRLRITLHDLGIRAGFLVMLVCYGLAAAGTVGAVVFLLRI